MHFDHSKVWNSSRYGRLGWLGGEVGMVGGEGATIPPLGMVTIPPPWDGWAVWPSTIPTLNAHPVLDLLFRFVPVLNNKWTRHHVLRFCFDFHFTHDSC